MDKYKHHIIYKTTNLINNKIYIGLHSTNNINDRYLGSGWALKSAIKKYGRDCFRREILFTFPSRDMARRTEASIVDVEFVSRPDTYNLQIGGMGAEDQWGKNNPMYGKEAHNRKMVKASHKDGTVITATSIQKLSALIGIDRANIRNLIKKGIRGKRGWTVEIMD